MGSLVQGKELAQIWRRERGGIRPLPSVGAKDAESGGKERSDSASISLHVQLLRRSGESNAKRS
jgi:hypothetical protein